MFSFSKHEASIYFHIPFCTKKCPYCHFYVLPDQLRSKQNFLIALSKEWELHSLPLKDAKIVSIYFGGGTPALLQPKEIGSILNMLRKSALNIASDCEITLEANPENITRDLMCDFAKEGINRASIGVQSLDLSQLEILQRTHNVKKAIRAVEDTYAAGIHNISIDLMYDLPEQTLQSWKNTLKMATCLPISHLSLYNLTIEPYTAFHKRKESLRPLLPSPEASLSMLEEAVAHLTCAGLNRYEISAFAKKSCHSVHNVGYWMGRPFLGFGPSAFSFWNQKRFRNICSLSTYSKRLAQGLSPIDFEEKLSSSASLKELLAIHLRLTEGVDLSLFQKTHGPLTVEMQTDLKKLSDLNLIDVQEDHVKLSDKGLLFYDTVAENIIEAPSD